MKSEQYLVYHFERRAYPLRSPVFTVGRDADSDLVLVRGPSVRCRPSFQQLRLHLCKQIAEHLRRNFNLVNDFGVTQH